MARVWYLQARAVIAHTFHAYTFEMLDALPLPRIIELYAAVEWISEAMKSKE